MIHQVKEALKRQKGWNVVGLTTLQVSNSGPIELVRLDTAAQRELRLLRVNQRGYEITAFGAINRVERQAVGILVTAEPKLHVFGRYESA